MSIVGDIMAEGAKFVGFVAFFVVMNTFVKGLGAFGGFLKGVQSRASGVTKDFGGKLGEDMAARSKLRALNGEASRFNPKAMLDRRNARVEGRREGVKREIGRATHGYLTGQTTTGSAYANEVAGGSRLRKAQPEALKRVLANAAAAKVKEFNEEVGNEKSTMSHETATNLLRIMEDETQSEARRSAAAGKVMQVGKATDIHDALNYLGGTVTDANGNQVARSSVDKAISSIQQQVASDIGSRKPTSLGAGDISSLNRGVYSGDFDSKIATRLVEGKFSAESLASTPPEELDKILSYVSANGAALKANSTTAAELSALEKDLAQYRANTLINQPANEVGSRMDDLRKIL